MSDIRAAPEVRYLFGLLDDAARRLCRAARVHVGLWVAATLLGALAAAVLVDASLRPGTTLGPWLYLAIILAGAAAGGMAVYFAGARTPEPQRIARAIEARRPAVRTALITFLELHADPDANPSMTLAVGRRAARALDGEPAASILPLPPLGRPVAVLAASAAALAVVLWLAQGAVVEPWVRLAHGGLIGGEAGAPAQPPRAVPAGPTASGPSAAALPQRPSLDGPGLGKSVSGGPPVPALPGQGPTSPGPRPTAPGPGPAIRQGPRPSDAGGGPEGSAATALARRIEAERSALARLAGALGLPETFPGAGEPVPAGASGVVGDSGGKPPLAGGSPADAPPAGAEPTGGTNGFQTPHIPVGGDPIPARPQPTPDPALADQTVWAKQVIEAADERLRDTTKADELVKGIGWSPAELRAYVSDWKRTFEAVEGSASDAPPAVRAGGGPEKPGELIEATGAGRLGELSALPGSGPGADEAPEDDTLMPERLRKIVDAYYDAINRRPTPPASPPGKPAPTGPTDTP